MYPVHLPNLQESYMPHHNPPKRVIRHTTTNPGPACAAQWNRNQHQCSHQYPEKGQKVCQERQTSSAAGHALSRSLTRWCQQQSLGQHAAQHLCMRHGPPAASGCAALCHGSSGCGALHGKVQLPCRLGAGRIGRVGAEQGKAYEAVCRRLYVCRRLCAAHACVYAFVLTI